MLAKRFFYVSAALFLLALTYHLGARSAAAQAPSNPVVSMAGAYPNLWVITANGDVYYLSNGCWIQPDCRNVFGTPTAGTPTTWGKVKADYRK